MKTITLRYGIGYGTHSTSLDFEDDASQDEIEQDVREYVMERLWWAHEVEEDEE